MKEINFIFLRSIVSSSEAKINQNKVEYLKDLNKNNDFIYTEYGNNVFFIESGGTEGIFKAMYKDYKEPYYLLAKDSNNALPAALEIATFLKKNNKKFFLITGTIEEVIENLKNVNEIKKVSNNRIFSETKILENLNFGVIGKPSDWLIASDVNYSDAKDRFGINLLDISIDEFLKNIPQNYDLNLFNIFKEKLPSKIDEEVLKGALKIYASLKALISKYKLSGLTIRCFDLLSSIKNTSCLALALLNKEGIIATCEGDVPTMISMAIVNKLFNTSSFQVNPSYINLKEKYGYFAHCTIPLDMCETYSLDTHYESGIGIGIKGKLYEKDVTIFKLNADLKHYEVFEGKMVENLNKNNLCRTQIKVQFFDEIDEILSSPNGNHLVVFYGLHKNEISSI